MSGFEWGALPSALSVALARSMRVRVAEVGDALTATYGRVPSSDFVHERWIVLRDAWLAHDAEAALAVASDLQRHGAGRSEMPLGDHAEVLDYLHTCRASRAIREVVLPALIEAGGGRRGDLPDPEGTNTAPAEKQDQLVVALGLLEADLVPELARLLVRGVALFGDDESVGESGAASLMVAAMFAITGIGKDLDGTDAAASSAVPVTVAERCTAVAVGARAWARSGEEGALFAELLMSAIAAAADGGPSLAEEFAGGVLRVIAGGPDASGVSGDLDALVEWATRRADAAGQGTGSRLDDVPAWPSSQAGAHESSEPAVPAGSAWSMGASDQGWPSGGGAKDWGAPSRPDGREAAASDRSIRDDELDPVAEYVGQWLDDPEYISGYGNGVQWLASDVGATALFGDEPVEIGDRPVTALRVMTMGHLERSLTDRQLATALSDANVHDGVSAIAAHDGVLALRSALVVHRDNAGWIPAPMCIAVVASALAALHLPPELRLTSAGTRRSVPHHFVARMGGWEIEPEDEADYQLPSLAQIEETFDWLGPFPHKTRRTERDVTVHLPGPNGRLERRRATRRGDSDDQLLVISKVTRPPWGAGVKFVLRLPTGLDEATTQGLAVEANLREWELVPNVVVWGGWSGEEGALRLTSFLPQSLMSSNVAASQRLVGSFMQYTIRRGEAIALQLGLA